MLRSIRWRLVLSHMLIALLTVGVVGVVTYRLVRDSLSQMEARSLQDNAEAVAQQAHALMWPQMRATELRQLAQTAAFLGDVHVQVRNSQGHIVADSDESGDAGELVLVLPGAMRQMWELRGTMRGPLIMEIGPDAFGDPPGPFVGTLPPGTSVTVIRRDEGLWGGRLVFGELLAGEAGATTRGLEINRTPRSRASVAAPIGDAIDPIGYVELSEPAALNTRLLDRIEQALLIAGLGAVGIAGLFGLWSSRRMATPIKSLAQTAARMGEGDLSVRAEVLRPGGEIGELATQFNQMADSLQSSFDQLSAERDALQRFIADASHELRTPITALKNFNTLLLSGAADDPATREEFLTESQAQIERLAWITGHLLDLSRRDAELVVLDIADHDLRDVARSAVAPFEPLSAEWGISLTTRLPEVPVTLGCDRAQMEMALGNLLDNALKATPQGGSVTVSLAEQGAQVTLSVTDTGIGIQPEDLPHVFERFYQGRRSEQESQSGPVQTGSGLGLAIVKSIVEAHGGAATIESTPGEGTTVTLTFPR